MSQSDPVKQILLHSAELWHMENKAAFEQGRWNLTSISLHRNLQYTCFHFISSPVGKTLFFTVKSKEEVFNIGFVFPQSHNVSTSRKLCESHQPWYRKCSAKTSTLDGLINMTDTLVILIMSMSTYECCICMSVYFLANVFITQAKVSISSFNHWW